MDEEENVFVFRDDALTSEPTFEYEEDVRIDQVPVVIDNGKKKRRNDVTSEVNSNK